MENEAYYANFRNRMVSDQIISRGVHDERLLEALRRVPRHWFVPEEYANIAYSDGPLPIGNGQTISQPYIVALMTELLELEGEENLLEVGTGSGYQAALLAQLARTVHTIPGRKSRKNLDEAGVDQCSGPRRRWFHGLAQVRPFRGNYRHGRRTQRPAAAI
jgi:protein-L-isoaspartate(D-aspartate) O-methyltransferase